MDAQELKVVATTLGKNCSSGRGYRAARKRYYPRRSIEVFTPGTALVDGEDHRLDAVYRRWSSCIEVWPDQAHSFVCLAVGPGNLFVYRLGRPEQVGPGVVCVCLAYILNIDNKNPLEKFMSEESKRKAPTWFMVVAAILLVWNFLGVMAYVAQVTMTPEALAMLPDAQRQLYENTPAWATAAFAVAVNFGALGCLLLLLKKNLAGLFLQLSLAGVLVQMYHSFFMSKSFEVFGPGGLIMPVMVLVLAIYLVMLAAKAKAQRWTS